MLFGTRQAAFERALQTTHQWDLVLGTTLNRQKSKWWAGRAGFLPGPLLAALTKTEGVVHLGTDFTQRSTARHRGRRRVDYVLHRARLTQCLPAVSRPNAVGDAVSALWLEGCTIINRHAQHQLSSGLAAALRGWKPEGRVRGRSRLVEHAIYQPGPCRSLPAARGIYLLMCRLMKWWCPSMADEWLLHWRRRQSCVVGPLAALRHPMLFLGCTWTSPTSICCAGRTVDFTSCPDRRPCSVQRWTHDLREALRAALWAREARRRPKDFAGAELGVQRVGIDQLRNMPSGPTVMAAGMWTAQRLALCQPPLAAAACVRCDCLHETKDHRLWLCSSERGPRQELLRQLPRELARQVPWGLPPCLRRCALVPLAFPWAEKHCQLVQHYIVGVAARAASALAIEKMRMSCSAALAVDFDSA